MQKQTNIPLGDAQPSVFYITQGSFGIMSTVELRDDTLYYSASCNAEPEVIDHLNPKRWQSFRQTLEFLQAEQWQPKYFNPNVLDGQQWEVKIAYADGRLIESRGSNAYPGLLDSDYTIYGSESLDWRLFTCALAWLTKGRWTH
jgi:hypothetical protein